MLEGNIKCDSKFDQYKMHDRRSPQKTQIQISGPKYGAFVKFLFKIFSKNYYSIEYVIF